MIKNIAWQTFKNTGDINTYLELKQIEEIEKEIVGYQFDTVQKQINENDYKKNVRN